MNILETLIRQLTKYSNFYRFLSLFKIQLFYKLIHDILTDFLNRGENYGQKKNI